MRMRATVQMNSIQDVFADDFKQAKNLLLQKCQSDERNVDARQENFSENWPAAQESFDLFGIAIGDGSKREIWVGALKDVIPSSLGRFRFCVDRFRKIGIHDLASVRDADFYANGGGGGSRIIVRNQEFPLHKKPEADIPGGTMEQRLGWVRKNHNVFRDKVWRHWKGKCAVYKIDCNGLLIASHIYPWSLCNPQQKTDCHNGLLLSAPLDYLFDGGYISFSDSGEILSHPKITSETLAIFGLTKTKIATISPEYITESMKAYLQMHRQYHGFPL